MQRTLLIIVTLLSLASAIAWAAATPTITAFTPTYAPYGQPVTLTGTAFIGATAVAFNGITAPVFKVATDTTLTVTVPTGATTGVITVTTPAGTATSATTFTVCNNPKDNADMVWVPAATFTMGSADGVGLEDEYPAHQVTLSGYWIYKYDVTVAQYRAFCTATKRALPEFPNDELSWKDKKDWEHPDLQQHPIVNVSWFDATDYADWAGVSLPTEAQWEYAARGPKGNNYPWGGIATKDDKTNGWDETKCANYKNSLDKDKSTWPVGSFPAGASWCGAQDMAGNVSQWCGDWNGYYSATAATDPTGPATGISHVLRGGSWVYDDFYNRGAFRDYGHPTNPNGYYRIFFGFRCASTAPGL